MSWLRAWEGALAGGGKLIACIRVDATVEAPTSAVPQKKRRDATGLEVSFGDASELDETAATPLADSPFCPSQSRSISSP